MKSFSKLPFWACESKLPIWELSGGDDNESPPDNSGTDSGQDRNGDGVPPDSAGNTDIADLLGGILSQIESSKATDREKQLAADLKAAQDLLEEKDRNKRSAEQNAVRDAQKAQREAEAKAALGEQAIAYAQTIGTKFAIEHLKDKDGKLKYTWNNIDTVFALLDRSKLEYDFDTGEVKGLAEQLDTLAKEQPFLLRPAESQGQPGSYGVPPGAGNSGEGSDNKTLADYASNPSYRNTLGRLAGLPQIPGAVITPQQRNTAGQ